MNEVYKEVSRVITLPAPRIKQYCGAGTKSTSSHQSRAEVTQADGIACLH
jgi:hypothetical protein